MIMTLQEDIIIFTKQFSEYVEVAFHVILIFVLIRATYILCVEVLVES
jgi:hypothetical protein